MSKDYHSLSSGNGSAAVRLFLMLTLICCILQAKPIETKAQTFEFSLESMSRLYEREAWDTLGPGDIRYLLIGEYYYYPNFLPYDFERVRFVEEYGNEGNIKVTFKVPLAYSFGHKEQRKGAFFIVEPRDLEIPGLEIDIESVDGISEEVRRESLHEVWRSTLVSSFTGKKEKTTARKGLIHVDIPLPLGPLESIFGKGEKTNIDVSGRESITFSGESRRVDPFIGFEGQTKQPLFPSLEMKQELDIRLRGQIGEKVNVQVDHTSNPYSENQNKIRLNYVGFEDDIVQLVELGNTSLSLPGSRIGSFSAASQGLFGIKMLAQMGPVDLTVVASKQEGKASSASFTPSGSAIGQMETRRIRDIDYVRNKFFFFNHPTKTSDFDLKKPKAGEVEVYQLIFPNEISQYPNAKRARAFVDSLGDGSDIDDARAQIAAGRQPPDNAKGDFRLLEFGIDYLFVLDAADESILGIELIQSIDDDRVLAVTYVNEMGDTIGDYRTSPAPDTLLLELIKPKNPRPNNEFGYTWDYMNRSIYNLQMSDIDRETLEIEIEDRSNREIRTIPEGKDVPYLRIFGLDQYDVSGLPGPDGRIDLTSGLIDLNRGLLTFPVLTAFNPPRELVAIWLEGDTSRTIDDFESYVIPELYEEHLNPTELEEVHEYIINVQAASTTRSFKIDAFNIIEGSDAVTIDGIRLTRDVDYTIDYATGEVNLKGDVANTLNPSSQIKIDYEYKPFAGGASSSLLGFNALWNISMTSRLGMTWLYQSRSSGSPHARLGEEPTRGVVGDVYGNLQFPVNALTDMVNLLPLVDTDAQSTVQVSGDIAASFPNPNTQGEVYIDDMEGIEDSDVISLSRRSWYWASPPVDPDGDGFTALSDTLRERFMWYNIRPEYGVHRRDLNPNLNERESSLVTSLDIEFYDTPDDSSYWGGVMTGFSGGGLDLSMSQFIEIWVNDFKPDEEDRGGILYIEMGAIDEDFYEPDKNDFNTEDANRDGFNPGLGEDTGFDGIPSGEAGDTSEDDYSADINTYYYTRINGTENNQRLDTEDLDRSVDMETRDSYFRFELDLTDTAEVDVRRDFPDYDGFRDSGHESDAWRLYRINLADAEEVRKNGTPSWNQVTHMRLWFDNVPVVTDTLLKRFQIAGLKIVGNRWEEDGVRDFAGQLFPDTTTDFTLGVINTKTEPIKYNPPILPNVQNEIIEKEQSLLLEYQDLEPGLSFRIRKRFPGNGQNYTDYRDLNFWVHTDILDDSLEYYFQIAFDDKNFYEISAPVTAKYFDAGGWMRVYIHLNDLTSLKFITPDSVGAAVYGRVDDVLMPGRSYTSKLVGKPDLFKVRFLYAGLRNISSDSTHVVSGELWLNDVYLGNVKRDIDYATTLSGSVNMGNIIKVNAQWRRTGPDYRGLQQRRGSGSLDQSYSVGLRTNVEHFFPLLGFSIPVSGNYSNTKTYPKFTPSSDTEIEDEARRDSLKTEASTRGFSTTLNRRGSKNPLLKYTFDKITANFSMSQSRRRAPSSSDTTTTMNGTFDYQITWAKKRDIRIFKNYRIRYWFNSLTYRMNASRRTGKRYSYSGNKLVKYPPTWSASLSQSGSASYVPFPSLTTSFKVGLNRDLRMPHKFLGVDIGREINRNQSLQMNYKPPPVWILRSLSPDLSYSSGYSEDSSPNVRKAGDPATVRNVNSNRSINLKTRLDIGKFFQKLFQKVHLEEKIKQEPKKPPSVPSGGSAVPTDTTGVEEGAAVSVQDTTKSKPRDPLIAVRKLGGILSRIRKVNASVQQRTRSNYSRIPARPSLLYQLGLSKSSDVTYLETKYDKPERYDNTLSISFDSGTQITQNIGVVARYSTSLSNSDFRGSESETRSVNWPDLSFSWNQLESFGPFRSLVYNASATFNIKKTWSESGRKGFVDARNESFTITPAISAGWKNGLNGNFAFSMMKKTSESRGSKSENSNISVSIDLKKSFTATKGFRLPIPFVTKRMKFKSRLDGSLNMSYTQTGARRFISGSDRFEELPGSSSIKVSPRFTYNFSSSLNGSFFVDYNRLFNDATNQTTTIIRIGISTVLTF